MNRNHHKSELLTPARYTNRRRRQATNKRLAHLGCALLYLSGFLSLTILAYFAGGGAAEAAVRILAGASLGLSFWHGFCFAR